MHEPHFLKILKVQGKETVKGSFCFENKITFLIYILQIIIDVAGSSDGKELACNAGGWGLIPGLGRSPGERNSNPLQYSCLGNPMDRVAWQATVQWSFKESHATEHTGTACRHGTATYISQSVQSLSHV